MPTFVETPIPLAFPGPRVAVDVAGPGRGRAEAILARPDDSDLIDVLLADPATVVLSHPDLEAHEQAYRLQQQTGVFDPLATWVTDLCRRRVWPALNSDPRRLRRLALISRLTRCSSST